MNPNKTTIYCLDIITITVSENHSVRRLDSQYNPNYIFVSALSIIVLILYSHVLILGYLVDRLKLKLLKV